jgi:hypothetical protein
MSLKTVYKPENELMAMSIKSLLEEAGIKVIMHSFQMPWYNGLAKMMRPNWGEILVEEEEYDNALELIKQFLASEQNDAENDDPDRDDHD